MLSLNNEKEEIPGERATVYPLEDPTLLLLPYNAALANFGQGVLVALTFGWWRWLITIPIFHVLLALLYWGDPTRIRKLLRFLRLGRYSHPG
jgi:hypothetical protein